MCSFVAANSNPIEEDTEKGKRRDDIGKWQ